MSKELRLFAKQVLTNPRNVGAVAPSGKALAQSMTDGISGDSGHVVELGPGTGSFTKALLNKGVLPQNLTLFEMDSGFCDLLKNTFPGVQVINQPAQTMVDFELQDVGVVVSSLPLLNMPENIQHAIVKSAFQTLRPGGRMVQFTYGSKPPIVRSVQDQLAISWTRRPKIWANLPPARVYEYTRLA